MEIELRLSTTDTLGQTLTGRNIKRTSGARLIRVKCNVSAHGLDEISWSFMRVISSGGVTALRKIYWSLPIAILFERL